MHRLVWRSLLALSLPLAMAACPGDDAVATGADSGPGDTEVETTTTTTNPTTKGADDTTTAASSDGSTADATTTGTTTDDDGATTAPVEFAVCGNNIIEGDEVCDLAQVNGETCTSLGYQGGTLGCLLTCTDYNLLGCFICGNEVIDIAEDCEGDEVPESVTCVSLGYQAGWVTCGDDCLYDTSECSICGDGVQQGPEQCDGIDYDGQTCMSLGFDAGNLGCNIATCTFNVSGCSGGQYLQGFEAGVLPPEFTVGGNLGWVVDNNMPITGNFSAHSGAITHSQTSSLFISANFAAAGNITFMHRESSEANYDYLRFFVDGVQVVQWSGNNAAAMYNHPVAAGVHAFEWRYIKDNIVNANLDRVWIDDITMIPGVPI